MQAKIEKVCLKIEEVHTSFLNYFSIFFKIIAAVKYKSSLIEK